MAHVNGTCNLSRKLILWQNMTETWGRGWAQDSRPNIRGMHCSKFHRGGRVRHTKLAKSLFQLSQASSSLYVDMLMLPACMRWFTSHSTQRIVFIVVSVWCDDASLPLYVMLHVIVMTSFSCMATEAEQLGLSAKSDASSWSCNMSNYILS